MAWWKKIQMLSFVSMLLAGSSVGAETNQVQNPGLRTVNVRDFGAKGDGTADDTAAFQKALNVQGKDRQGGTVFVPRGNYVIRGHLEIPQNVTLEGIWNNPTAWSQYKGTTLLAYEGAGKIDGTPFISLGDNSTVKGITIFYPEQVGDKTPIPYPWTIASSGGDNQTILDVLIVNPYQAVDFGSKKCGRHLIRNLYGQPLYKGVYVDWCLDVGRIENVHFWPFWTCGRKDLKAANDFMNNNATAFIFARTDWEFVLNTFCFGYKVGYHFIKSEHGMTNGNFLGIAADASGTAIKVDHCWPYGLLITNGEFVSFLGANPQGLEVGPECNGLIQMQNCAFWGDFNNIATIKGRGTVTFNNCSFMGYGRTGSNVPAIDCQSGNLIISGSSFFKGGQHITLRKGVESAVITGNRFTDKISIDNQTRAEVQIGLNVSTKALPELDKQSPVKITKNKK